MADLEAPGFRAHWASLLIDGISTFLGAISGTSATFTGPVVTAALSATTGAFSAATNFADALVGNTGANKDLFLQTGAAAGRVVVRNHLGVEVAHFTDAGDLTAGIIAAATGVITIAGTNAGIRIDANLTPRYKGRDITLANNAIGAAISDGLVGYLHVSSDDNEGARFFVRGTAHSISLVDQTLAGVYSAIGANAGTMNVYWDAGNARYSIENKRGASRTATLTFIGQ